MGDLQTLMNRMVYWCRDANMGYSQYDRWNFNPSAGNCDCSSLVIHCLQEAGFDTGGATYTGNMWANLSARGWSRLPVNGNPQPGDILLNDANHVAVYLGGGLLAQASISEYNSIAGNPGDQTGRETNISGYYNYPWNCYLRYQGGNMPTAQEIAQAVGSYRYNNNDTIYNYVHYASDNSGQLLRLVQPRFFGAKDTAERLLWVPGHGVIPLYEPSEMAEMAADWKNITGHVIPTVLFATAKQMHYAIAILENKSAEERKKLKP